MFSRILVVCVGNICRSPMAEALLRRKIAETEKDMVIQSAGIAALVGYPADPLAVELMAEREIDISAHRARQLTPTMIMEFDLVLAMEASHVKTITCMVPSARGRVFHLGKWSGFDIDDPYRKPRQAFQEALLAIDRGVNDWTSRILS